MGGLCAGIRSRKGERRDSDAGVGSPLVTSPLTDEQIASKWQEFSRSAKRLFERLGTDGELTRREVQTAASRRARVAGSGCAGERCDSLLVNPSDVA